MDRKICQNCKKKKKRVCVASGQINRFVARKQAACEKFEKKHKS